MKKQHTNIFAVLVLGAGVLMAGKVQAGDHHYRERHPDLRLAVDIIGTILYAASPKTVVIAPEPTQTYIVTEPVCRPRTVVVSSSYCPAPVVYHRPAPVVYHRPAPVVYHRPAPVVYHRGGGHFDRGGDRFDRGGDRFDRGGDRFDRGRGNHITVRNSGRHGR